MEKVNWGTQILFDNLLVDGCACKDPTSTLEGESEEYTAKLETIIDEECIYIEIIK